MMTLQFHPLADIFPLIEGEEFDNLVADIRDNGLREAIWLHPEDGSIIDGRNRYRACLEAKVEPQFREWDGTGSLVTFLLSLNLRRRHLNDSQKATVATELVPFLSEEARARQVANLKRGAESPVTEPVQEREKGEAAEFAAKIVGVTGRYVYYAQEILKAVPFRPLAATLWQEVKSGKTTITQARRILQKAEVTEAAKLPSGKYRVIYADPPWKYGDELTEAYGPAELHYPAMTIPELCALPVADLTKPDAVLFLWVTSPLLESAFPVIKAWEFEYKTSFVWDKVKHNMGHYNSVRHELLLVAVRGSCTPDVPKLYDSVLTIERTRHSAKPPQFRRMIDTLYPHGKRLELFAREQAEGWQTWGNQRDASQSI
jgi:N6-adenosine-specific RNA methylase IME4